jgi:hypothetical protein
MRPNATLSSFLFGLWDFFVILLLADFGKRQDLLSDVENEDASNLLSSL